MNYNFSHWSFTSIYAVSIYTLHLLHELTAYVEVYLYVYTDRMGERSVHRVLVGYPEGQRRFERPRSRCEDGIRMDLREIGWGGAEWILPAQDRGHWRAVVNAVMNLRVLAPLSYLVSRLVS
jgi:hypothetical protein